LVYIDTANVVFVIKVQNPIIGITGDLEACGCANLCVESTSVLNTHLWSNGDVSSCTTDCFSGIISVQATDTNACVDYDTVTVIIHDNPIVELGNDTTILANESIILDAGIGFANYTWNTPSGNFDNSSSTYTADSTNVGIGTGVYTVTITDDNGCASTDIISITYEISNAIFESLRSDLVIYPNPATDYIVVKCKNVLPESCEILDVTGKSIRLIKIQDLEFEIQISDLEKGIYFIRIEKQIKKLIIE
jgi:hypothetical protein